VPAGTYALTAGIDIGGRLLHWVVVAWKEGQFGHIVDYGTHSVNSPMSGKLTAEHNQSAVEAAVRNALLEFADFALGGWKMEGQTDPRLLDLVLVDSGWQDKAVYQFCRASSGIYKPSKGFGSSHRLSYRQPAKGGKDRLVGNNWACMYQHADNVWLYHVNSDFWKLSVQNGFLLPTDKPGSLTLWGADGFAHKTFAKHICAERWVREFVPGKGTKEYFTVEHKQNHYLDALHYAAAASSILGVRVIEDSTPARKKVSFAQMQQDKKNRRNG